MYKLVKLKKIANVTTGFPFKGELYSDEGIRVVRGENVTVGSLRWDSIKCWNQEFEQFDKYSLKEGDVVIGMDGSKVGKNRARIKATDLPLLLAQRIACLRSNELSNQSFLYYLIRDNRFEEFVQRIQTGSSVPHISQNQIEEFTVPFIPIDIQRKISEILLNLDTKIELNNRINAQLEAMAKTFYDYWFVQFDFPNAKGKPYKTSGGKMIWNEVLKREIPKDWEVKPISFHLDCNLNTIKKSSNIDVIKYLDTSNITENQIDFVQEIDFQNGYVPSRAQRVVKKDDILFSTVRPNLHHFGIIKKPIENMIASTGFAILSHKTNADYNDLFYMFISIDLVLKKLEGIASSSVSSYPSISPTDILNLLIALPNNLQDIEVLSNKFSSIFLTIAIKQKENQKLSELRDWLLPMLMNGQVKVI